MAAFSGATFTTTEATDWEAGDFLRFDKFRDQIGQNIEYLKAQADAVVSTNYWLLYAQRLQSGLAPGSPFA